jgi:cytochrome oxidase Cu insertion factor (SCO1/SenC/PrrC family)
LKETKPLVDWLFIKLKTAQALSQKYSPRQLLSGPPAAVLALLQGLGIPYQRDEKTGMVDHPPLIYVLDAQGKVVYQLSHPSPAWIEEALRRVQKAG